MLNGIKGILFDLDNTLIDRQQAALHCMQAIVDHYLPQLKDQPMERENAIQCLMNWDEYGTVNKTHVFGSFCQKFDLPEETAEELKIFWSEKFGNYTVPFKTSREVVEKLRTKYKVGIVTNGLASMQRRKLEICDFDELFDTILVSGEFGKHKPDVSIFLEGACKLGLRPEEIAFVGDTFATDIIGAYRAGMQPIWIFSDRSRQAQADITRIYNIEELLEIL